MWRTFASCTVDGANTVVLIGIVIDAAAVTGIVARDCGDARAPRSLSPSHWLKTLNLKGGRDRRRVALEIYSVARNCTVSGVSLSTFGL